MDENERPVVEAIGRGIVAEVAPAELPMYGTVVRAHAGGQRRKDPSRRRPDDPLGFGLGESVVLLAPIAVMFAEEVWHSLAAQTADSSGKALARAVRRLLGRDRPAEVAPLTPAQLAHVRDVGQTCAGNLPLSPQEQTLFVDALVGLLAVPRPPAAASGETRPTEGTGASA